MKPASALKAEFLRFADDVSPVFASFVVIVTELMAFLEIIYPLGTTVVTVLTAIYMYKKIKALDRKRVSDD